MEAALKKLLETMERLDITSAKFCAARGHAESAAYLAARGVAIPTAGIGQWRVPPFGQLSTPPQPNRELEVDTVDGAEDEERKAPVWKGCTPAREPEPECGKEEVTKEEEVVDDGGAERCRGEPDLKCDSEGVSGDAEVEQLLNGDDDVDADRKEDQAAATKDKARKGTPTPAVGAGTEKSGTRKASAGAAAMKEVTNTTPKPAADKEPARDLCVSGKRGMLVSSNTVGNSSTPAARCFASLTTSTAEEKNKRVQHLHCSERHGKVISVECTGRGAGDALQLQDGSCRVGGHEDHGRRQGIR
ncbi:scaffold attachment factor B1-like [Rhipicephalus sanguineus]|uniref:scaffold attachment factor B1-like n=1 Tax=Rhipicephalus sanguineus TaxID=34632 RepID=UPI00189449C9|nr:scaffold attachment factor B1-like [Rhipicephalus sanguineus]